MVKHFIFLDKKMILLTKNILYLIFIDFIYRYINIYD